MDSNYWSRHGETALMRAIWFPRTARPARSGIDPERDEKFESVFLQRRVSNEPSAGDLPEARRQAQCSLRKNGSTFLTSANQAECPMRLFWLHLADLFLGITIEHWAAL
jgi:hypothetical protein